MSAWKGEILLDDEVYPTQLTNVSRSGTWRGELVSDLDRFSDREDMDNDSSTAVCSLCGWSRDQCGHWRVLQKRQNKQTSSSAIGRSSSPISVKKKWLSLDGSLSISPSSSPSPMRKLHGVARAICRLSPSSRSPAGSPMASSQHWSPSNWTDGSAMERQSSGTDSEAEKEPSRDGTGDNFTTPVDATVEIVTV